MGVFRPGVLPGSHAGQCCLGASECLGSCGRPAPPPAPRRLFTTPLLSASPHCSVLLTTPLLSASPHCSVLFTILFSAPLLTALSLPCGPCGFPYPCWLPSSVPCGCSLSWAESLAFAGLAAALLQMPLVSSCPPPCRSCLPAALVLSASGVIALQRQEGFTSLVFSVSRFIEEKTAALK